MVVVVGAMAVIGAVAGDDTSAPTTDSLRSASSSTIYSSASAPATSINPTTTEASTFTTSSTAVTSSTSAPSTSASTTETAADQVELVKVVDGDTVVVLLADGRQEDVRLIGIDTPETGEEFADEATAALRSILESKPLRLEEDVEVRDQYERLLAYVWAGCLRGYRAMGYEVNQGPSTVSERRSSGQCVSIEL